MFLAFTRWRASITRTDSSGGGVVIGVSPPAHLAQWFEAAALTYYGAAGSQVPGGVVFTGARRAYQFGLISPTGAVLVGLCPRLVYGDAAVAQGIWRGVLLAARAAASNDQHNVVIACPTYAAAVAVRGAARRLGVTARVRDTATSGAVEFATEDFETMLAEAGVSATTTGEAIAELSGASGAPTRAAHQAARRKTPSTRPGNRHSLAQVNQARAVETSARRRAELLWAIEVLGEHAIAAHLLATARLCLDNPDLSIAGLAEQAPWDTNKDTIAGQLRRLIATAKKATHHHDTYTGPAAELTVPEAVAL